MPPAAFKGVTEWLADGKEAYSPVLGMIALEQGLIHNLRFYGSFEPYFHEGERTYIYDSSSDPLWKLVKELFPSPAGRLGFATSANTNFGKYDYPPEIIALLLEYAYMIRNPTSMIPLQELSTVFPDLTRKLRDFLKVQTIEVRASITNALKTVVERSPDVSAPALFDLIKKLENTPVDIRKIDQAVGDIKREVGKLIDHQSEEYQQFNRIFQDFGQTKFDLNGQQVSILEKGVVRNYTGSDLQRQYYVTRIMGMLESSKIRRNLKPTVNSILQYIHDSVLQEQEDQERGSKVYPKHITEQVVLAFFCEKFDTQADMWALLRSLPEGIVPNKAEIPGKEDLLTKDDLETIVARVNNQERITLDDFYNLAHMDAFFAPVPYKAKKVQPLSNGSTRVYDRKSGREIQDVIFSDCVEISIRHLINLVIYDSKQKDFNLNYIGQGYPGNPFWENFVEFYKIQKPASANSGNIKIRSLWNQVVGDLNAYDNVINPAVKISYVRSFKVIGAKGETRDVQYELTFGFINFINVFRKIFNLKLEDSLLESLDLSEASIVQKKQWVKKYLMEILTFLNSAKTYEVEDNIREEENVHGALDLFGTIKVLVTDGTKQLFSFVIDMSRGHGEIANLDVPVIENGPYYKVFKNLSFPAGYHAGTSMDSLVFLLDEPMAAHAQLPLLYQLFFNLIDDNNGVITFLNSLIKIGNDGFTNKKAISDILSNVLRTFIWDDWPGVQEVSPLLVKLNDMGFSDVLSDHVKVFASETIPNEELQDMVGSLSNVEIINLSGNKKLTTIFLEDFPKLKKAFLFGSSVQNIEGLENLAALEDLNLGATNNLEKVSLKNLRNLRSLALFASAVQEVDLENLPALERLNLSRTTNLTSISLENLPSLRILDLGGSMIQEIKNWEGLPALEKIYLDEQLPVRQEIVQRFSKNVEIIEGRMLNQGGHPRKN